MGAKNLAALCAVFFISLSCATPDLEQPRPAQPVLSHDLATLAAQRSAEHAQRYRQLFSELLQEGMDRERIIEIFSAPIAQHVDTLALASMRRKRTPLGVQPPAQQVQAATSKMKRHIQQHFADYLQAEQRYGVNREIIAAVLYKETRLGAFSNWQHDAFSVLNSVLQALDSPDSASDRERKRIARLITLAYDSLKQLLLFCDRHGIDLIKVRFPSSFAGAIGLPQFMPLYLPYASSSDSSVPNLSRPSDAILSMAYLLKERFAWPGLLNFDRLRGITPLRTQYIDYDRETKDASFCQSVDLDDYPLRSFSQAFTTLPNIDYIAVYCAALMNYNFSSNYVLDVLQLAYQTYKLR